MIWFTSDLHIGHDKAFLYEPRGFSAIRSHDWVLEDTWNSCVKEDDEIYILGDLIMNDQEYGLDLLNRLNGKKHIIMGNHDTLTKVALYRTVKGVDSIKYADIFKYKKLTFFLSHYPTISGRDDKKLSNCVINLHGHTHSKEKFYEDRFFMYNVALDAHDMRPVSIDEIITDIRSKYLEARNNDNSR